MAPRRRRLSPGVRHGLRIGTAAVLLGAGLVVGFRRIGPLPPLGPFLDPVHGVWAVAAQPDFPARIAVPTLADTVRVVFDDRAVPHVFARNEVDAARVLGYLHAWFRLFQLELQTRVAAGRLAEWLGPSLLGFDRQQRALGLAWSAEREYERLAPGSTLATVLEAYAEGVNARIAELGPGDLPLEYRLLAARPAAWMPVHTLYLMKRMGYTLAYLPDELTYERLVQAVGPAAAAALLPVNSPIQQPIVPSPRTPRIDTLVLPPPVLPLPAAADSTVAWHADPERRDASNNWVVAPWRTADGHALLAGDPHLDLSLPSIWFEAHLVVPDTFDLYGVTFPGAPLVAIGFNRDVAWSFTNTGADVLDFYEEELDDPVRPSRYRVDGAWRPLESRIERYRGPDGRVLAEDTLYVTHRGPLRRSEGHARSMRWTVLDAQNVEALRNAGRARTVVDWLTAMEPYRSPIQNGLVADRGGDIAVLAAGAYPIRPPGGSGLSIWDGRTSASDWLGTLPPTRYPYARNPTQGFLASANQQPLDPKVDPAYLGAGWPSPWRAMRINQLLRSDSSITPDAMRRFQTDPGSARADWFAPEFLAAVEREAAAGHASEDARTAARLLAEWDRRYTLTNERAVLFEYAMEALDDHTWDEFAAGPARGYSPSSTILAILLRQPGNRWWDDRRTTDVVETRDRVLTQSLAEGYRRAVTALGPPDGGGWRWDRVRHQNIWHPLRFRALSALEIPVQGGPGLLNPSAGSGTHGASWRMVVELGPEVRAWGVYPGGQSGNPLSAWYTDRLPRWTAGELDPLPFPATPDALPADRRIAEAVAVPAPGGGP